MEYKIQDMKYERKLNEKEEYDLNQDEKRDSIEKIAKDFNSDRKRRRFEISESGNDENSLKKQEISDFYEPICEQLTLLSQYITFGNLLSK